MRIGIRRETERVIVFDDLLSLTPCHMLSVPKTAWIPDFRFLFNHCGSGLKLMKELRENAKQAVYSEFWSNEEFRSFYNWESFARVKLLSTSTTTCAGSNAPAGAGGGKSRDAVDGAAGKEEDAARLFEIFFENCVILGLNFPPSQYWLHLQTYEPIRLNLI